MSDDSTNPTKPYDFRDDLAERDPVLYEVLENIKHPELAKSTETKKQLKKARQAFIEQFYEARVHNHMTQIQLAQKTGLSQTAIARLESGKSNPTLKTLLTLAQALEVTLTVEPQSVKLKKT